MILLKKIKQKISRSFFGNTIRIGNYNVYIGRGHNLPSVLERYPDYGDNLIRLSRSVYSIENKLSIIDIGANVGDTIAMLLTSNSAYEIIAIEGDDYFFTILKRNFPHSKNLHTYKIFLGEKDNTVASFVNRSNGTLRLEEDKSSANTIDLITLDSFLRKNPQHSNAKILKIDTDGYDNRILRGSKIFLTDSKPVLYFEYDSQLLKNNKENGLEIFNFLESCGYQKVLFYDNYGRFITSTDIENKDTINQLHRYINERLGAFAFYDLIVFHKDDQKLAENFIKSEESLK